MKLGVRSFKTSRLFHTSIYSLEKKKRDGSSCNRYHSGDPTHFGQSESLFDYFIHFRCIYIYIFYALFSLIVIGHSCHNLVCLFLPQIFQDVATTLHFLNMQIFISKAVIAYLNCLMYATLWLSVWFFWEL